MAGTPEAGRGVEATGAQPGTASSSEPLSTPGTASGGDGVATGTAADAHAAQQQSGAGGSGSAASPSKPGAQSLAAGVGTDDEDRGGGRAAVGPAVEAAGGRVAGGDAEEGQPGEGDQEEGADSGDDGEAGEGEDGDWVSGSDGDEGEPLVAGPGEQGEEGVWVGAEDVDEEEWEEWRGEGEPPLVNYWGSGFADAAETAEAPPYLPPERKGRRPTRDDKGTWVKNERAFEEARTPPAPPVAPHVLCAHVGRRGCVRARARAHASTWNALHG